MLEYEVARSNFNGGTPCFIFFTRDDKGRKTYVTNSMMQECPSNPEEIYELISTNIHRDIESGWFLKATQEVFNERKTCQKIKKQ